tara:strand:- start:310 stop:1098 length:789 start_codon:yes stop_codon:yes gene_type:complete
MDIINVIVLGIIQGLTEFLPVSSSGHLEIAQAILGEKKTGSENLLLTVVLHAATACSTIFVFRQDIGKLISNLLKTNSPESKYSLLIIVSMVPSVIVGLFFIGRIETLFGGALNLVGVMLILTGIILLVANRAKNSNKTIGKKEALIIGLAQAFAIIPGVSRSGATISTAVLLGLDKEHAARFSFLMVIPLILGKMTQDIFSGKITEAHTDLHIIIIGFLVAFFVGVIACKWMIKIVKQSQLSYFSFYCCIVGFLVLLFPFL